MNRCSECDGFIFGYCHHCRKGKEMAEIKDSGTRREFSTGAVRDMGNEPDGSPKGRFDLIPWEVIWDLAKHFQKGADKYGPNNWQKGIDANSYFDSAQRHLVKHHLGHTDEDHAIAALWNICCMIWEERYSPRAQHPPEAKTFHCSSDLKCEKCDKPMEKGYAIQEYGKIKKICSKCYAELMRLP